MKLNPIGIIGGIILIISPFLTWISVFFFNISLLDMILQSGAGLGTDYLVILLVLILLIVGGIVAFFKGLIGGIIGSSRSACLHYLPSCNSRWLTSIQFPWHRILLSVDRRHHMHNLYCLETDCTCSSNIRTSPTTYLN